ncbi:histidine phosphatase family protein [Streptomyces sp. NPDC091212]|uniref:histidine phosphatase family protein n=1 Tax=Streptomyces sp. NPDC091212 TaxID=3155191 RepID=UPI00341BE04A
MLISPAMSTALREARFPGPAGDHPAGDDDLDATGLRQAEAVREDFPRTAAVYVSPTRRCRRTARALGLTADPLDGPAPDGLVPDGLAPCAMGHWQGRTLDEVAAAEPQSVAAWLSDPAAAPHGGESLLDFHVRVAQWLEAGGGLEAGSADHRGDGDDADTGTDTGPGAAGSAGGPGRRIVVVAEPDIIRAATVHAVGAPPSAFWRIDVRPLSVTELSGRNGRWNLLSGRPLTSHLSPEL